MKTKLLPWGFIWMAVAVILLSCDDDEKPKTIPEVKTSAVTNVTATSATGGGEVTSDGNAEITARGLVYSSVNATPTLFDSKTVVTGVDGAFASDLEGLTSGVTYHVRAYATNSVGTGYGNVVDFTTNNLAPTATDVAIDGTVEVDQEVMATYSYNDAESDPESGTTFQWYIADDVAGSGEMAIAGATSDAYTIDVNYEFKYLRVGVIPKSSAGTATGIEIKSVFSQVAASTTKVRFTYNGEEVAYDIITSSITGRQWLDRNLGAKRAATSYLDYLAYGDLFQWGRLADGHQLLTRDGVTQNSNLSGTTTTLSSTDVPVNSLFFIDPNYTSPNFDWRNPPNDDLWQMVDGHKGVNDPCPDGWHIPTNAEWNAEISGTEAVGEILKLTTAGRREGADGVTYDGGPSPGAGHYWSSTSVSANGYKFGSLYIFRASALETISSDLKYQDIHFRYHGYSCRCIKDE